jgi:sugar-specific transcriptional regulator TrmB
MDTSVLQKAGLTESQAKGYMALIENGPLTPVELAEKTGENRTNAYAIADKLAALGLATKDEQPKLRYKAKHPSHVEALAEKRRKVVIQNEQTVKQGLPELVNLFYMHSELPGTRTLQGVEGIKTVYRDTLAAKQPIYLLRTTADVPDLGQEFLDNYRKQRASAGIHTHALTPDTPIARQNMAKEDEQMLFHRTFLPDNCYTAPVEIDVYGHKAAFIAYGDTQMATIIDSPPIAEAMRQLLGLIAGQQPLHAAQTGSAVAPGAAAQSEPQPDA